MRATATGTSEANPPTRTGHGSEATCLLELLAASNAARCKWLTSGDLPDASEGDSSAAPHGAAGPVRGGCFVGVRDVLECVNWAARQGFIHICYVVEARDISQKPKKSENLRETPRQNVARAPTTPQYRAHGLGMTESESACATALAATLIEKTPDSKRRSYTCFPQPAGCSA